MRIAALAIGLMAAALGVCGCSIQEQPGDHEATSRPSHGPEDTSSVSVTWSTDEGPWVLFITSPRAAGDFLACVDVPAVDSSLQSADLPTSHVSATFASSATKDDVAQVVECLEGNLTSGDISIERAGG